MVLLSRTHLCVLFCIFQSPFQSPPVYPEPPPMPRGPLPSQEEMSTLLHSQAGYMRQLEAENRYMKVSIKGSDYDQNTNFELK